MELKNHHFEKSLEVGAGGEQLILNFIKTLKAVENVVDVSAMPEYRKIDVDFVVTTKSDDVLYYELKTEPMAAHTRNLFFEFLSNEERVTKGCFMYSEAHYWMSFIPQTGDLYIFPMELCRAYVQKASKYLTPKRIRNIVGYNQYHSVGYAIKITEVCQNVPHNKRNIKDFVSYDYIEENYKIGQKAEFKNVVWKELPQK